MFSPGTLSAVLGGHPLASVSIPASGCPPPDSATKKGALANVFPQVAHNDEAVSVGEIVSEVAITSRPQKDPAAVGPAGGESSSDGGSQDGDEQSESGDDDE